MTMQELKNLPGEEFTLRLKNETQERLSQGAPTEIVLQAEANLRGLRSCLRKGLAPLVIGNQLPE